ncbi:hypothetical protein EOM81_01700 [bacterium]|nr:hypothetical protein [bacterium]
MNYTQMVERIKNSDSTYESVVFKESDPLGMLIHLTPGGTLVNCWSKPLSKKVDFWGYIQFVDGKPHRVKFE